MDYVIKNHKNVYIRLNEKGTPVTCAEFDRQLFEYSKAKYIVDNLQKNLKKLKFRVEAVPEIKQEVKNKDTSKEKKKSIYKDYIPPDTIIRWVDKFGTCEDILKEARQRRDELIKELSDVNKEICDIEHDIEFGGKIDLYGGWIERNKIQSARKRRRDIKNEMLIVSNVLRMDFRCFSRENIQKAVDGLGNMKYTYRIVEEDEENKAECGVKDAT